MKDIKFSDAYWRSDFVSFSRNSPKVEGTLGLLDSRSSDQHGLIAKTCGISVLYGI